MQDVSFEIDALLEGVVPEQKAKLVTNWGTGPDRVRLTASSGFDIQQSYGCIQVTQPFLDVMWLVGAGIWNAIQASADHFQKIEQDQAEFSPDQMDKIANQAVFFKRFSEIIDAAKKMGRIENPADFDWPSDVPIPQPNVRGSDPEWQATYDLIVMSTGYAFLHEIRHFQIEKSNLELNYVDEEHACDAYAREMMLDDIADYAASSGYPESQLRAKRLLAIMFAKLVILTVTPRPIWSNSQNHPPVKERIRKVLEIADEPLPTWFWFTIAGLLAMFAKYNNLLHNDFSAMPSRELALGLCDLFDS